MEDTKQLAKVISIYFTDRVLLDKLCEENMGLWYGKTGSRMAKGEVITKALMYFKSFLSDEAEAEPSYPKGIKSIGRLNR